MATVEYFEMSPSGLARAHNLAMEQVMRMLVENGDLTVERAEDLLTKYAFVAIRNNSVLSRVKAWLFRSDDKEPTYNYVLAKLPVEKTK